MVWRRIFSYKTHLEFFHFSHFFVQILQHFHYFFLLRPISRVPKPSHPPPLPYSGPIRADNVEPSWEDTPIRDRTPIQNNSPQFDPINRSNSPYRNDPSPIRDEYGFDAHYPTPPIHRIHSQPKFERTSPSFGGYSRDGIPRDNYLDKNNYQRYSVFQKINLIFDAH